MAGREASTSGVRLRVVWGTTHRSVVMPDDETSFAVIVVCREESAADTWSIMWIVLYCAT